MNLFNKFGSGRGKTAAGKLAQWASDALQKLSKAGLVRDAGILAGGTAVAQVILVTASPLLTRLYPPADFGVLAVYGSVVSLLSAAAALKYDGAIPLPERDSDAAHLLVLALSLLLLSTGTAFVLCWMFGSQLAAWTDSPPIESYWWLIPLGMLGTGSYHIFNYWAMRDDAYPLMARTRINRSIGKIGSQLGLGVVGVGPLGLIVGDILGRSIGTTTLASLLKGRVHEFSQELSLYRLKRLALKYRKFPLFESGSSLLYAAGLQLPPLLMAVSYSSQETGWFSLSLNVLGMPVGLIAHAVSQAYVGNSSDLAREDPGELKRLFYRTARQLTVIGAVPAMVVFFFGPELFAFVFGDDWSTAGTYARILSVLFLAQFIVTPFSHTLNLVSRQELALAWEGCRFVLVLGAFLLMPYLSETAASSTLMVYSGSVAAAYVALFAIYATAINQLADETRRPKA